jgi:hypothetical protein
MQTYRKEGRVGKKLKREIRKKTCAHGSPKRVQALKQLKNVKSEMNSPETSQDHIPILDHNQKKVEVMIPTKIEEMVVN